MDGLPVGRRYGVGLFFSRKYVLNPKTNVIVFCLPILVQSLRTTFCENRRTATTITIVTMACTKRVARAVRDENGVDALEKFKIIQR